MNAPNMVITTNRMIEPFTFHVMPNGQTCYYRDSDHSYWRNIKRKKDTWAGEGRLTGVTTAIGPYDFDKGGLLKWAARMNGIGIAQLFRAATQWLDGTGADPEQWGDLSWLADHETIWKKLEAEALTFEDVREQAGVRGTTVHKRALYALALGFQVDRGEWGTATYMSDEEWGYCKGVQAFWMDHNPRTRASEQVVMDLALGVSGRFDFWGDLTECKRSFCGCHYDPVLPGIVDAKTSGYLGRGPHVQCAAYRAMANHSGFVPQANPLILQVTEEGDYDLIPVRAEYADFAKALDIFRRGKEIDKAARAYYKARKEAAT